tara:strand:- start:281 stop:388 length:108 start_codon:yes stop_codon:yes gene_type:complete
MESRDHRVEIVKEFNEYANLKIDFTFGGTKDVRKI